MTQILPVHELFPHEADMGVRGTGATLHEAFEQAALAMMSIMVPPQNIASHSVINIECEAPDDELLFVDWLNALVYEMATRNMLFGRFDVKISDHHLQAQVWGEAIDVARHQPVVEVKGATYTGLRVAKENGIWLAQCVVDV